MNLENLSLLNKTTQAFSQKVTLEIFVGRFTIRTIANSSELLEAFKLRYQVFQFEMIGHSESEGIDFYLLAGLSETARFFFQAAFKKFGDSPRVMGYYLILNWSATNHEVNDLNISSYEKKFGPINVKWLKEKINELGISRRSISVPGTEIG